MGSNTTTHAGQQIYDSASLSTRAHQIRRHIHDESLPEVDQASLYVSRTTPASTCSEPRIRGSAGCNVQHNRQNQGLPIRKTSVADSCRSEFSY